MKKILFFALALMPKAHAQCDVPFAVPYQMDAESIAAPQLPECSVSYYNSFSSQEEFQTLAGPIEGYSGNVFAYNTIVASEFIPPESPVSVVLYSPGLFLEQGVNYIMSYKYGNSDAQLAIDNLYVSLSGPDGGQTNIAEHFNITGAVASAHTTQAFTVPATGNYYINFSVFTTGSQGLLYLDDIEIHEAPAMGIETPDAARAAVYPNPVADVLAINTGAVKDVAIYDTAGQEVYNAALQLQANVDMSRFAAGVYFVAIRSKEGSEVIRIIKK